MDELLENKIVDAINEELFTHLPDNISDDLNDAVWNASEEIAKKILKPLVDTRSQMLRDKRVLTRRVDWIKSQLGKSLKKHQHDRMVSELGAINRSIRRIEFLCPEEACNG